MIVVPSRLVQPRAGLGPWGLIPVITALLLMAQPLTAESQATAISRALDATLMLFSDDLAGRFLGSGFVFDTGGTGLSNAHVVGDATTLVVQFRDGRREVAQVVARDPRRDIAILRLTAGHPALPLVSDLPAIGTAITALGAPLGLGFTATRGIVSAKPRQVDATVPLRLIQHDAAINPGSSGGPLIDTQGRLIGMNTRIANGSRLFVGVGYAIGASDLTRLVARMQAGTLAPVPVLGLDLRAVDAVIARAMRLDRTGLLIDNVQAGSAAHSAGLQAGDILLDLNDCPLKTPGDLAFCLDARTGPVQLRVLSANGTRQVVINWSPSDERPSARQTKVPDQRPGLVVNKQAQVTEVVADGPAGRAGLLTGDTLLRINGRPSRSGPLGPMPLVLLVQREDRRLHIIVTPPSDQSRLFRLGGGNRLDLAVRRF